MDSIANVKIIVEASDRRGVIRRAEFDSTTATSSPSGFSAANAMTGALRQQVWRETERADEGKPSKFDEPATGETREDEPEPRDVTMTNEPPEGWTGVLRFTTPCEPEPELHVGLFIERGRWYPDMPDMLPGENSDQYTNRLTGCYGQALIPYDHRRYRECSIGFHGTCSQRATPAESRTCQCPCHAEVDTISAAARRLGAANRSGQAALVEDEPDATVNGEPADLTAGFGAT